MSKKKSNPGYGKAFTFHGSFVSLILARRREREIPGSFIHQHKGRYYVLKPKKIRTNCNPRKREGRIDIERAGNQWIIYDHLFKEVKGGPFTSYADARSALRILKSRARYTTSPRYHAKLGFKTKYPGGQKSHKNPKTGTLIYGRVLKIFAQKTSGPFKGQRFVHAFKAGAIMYGMPDGSLKIIHK